MSVQRFNFSVILILTALVFWWEMFALNNFNFWIEMLFASGLLAALGLYINHKNGEAINYRLYFFQPAHIIIGLLSAAILYGIFFGGGKFIALIYPALKEQIEIIYHIRSQFDIRIIGVLLVLFIAPAEEVFWRGFIQDTFMEKFGDTKGWLLTAAVYAGVHAVALNLMLVVAALVCGLFWGLIFKKYRSLWPGIISHSLWDFMIFVLMPVI